MKKLILICLLFFVEKAVAQQVLKLNLKEQNIPNNEKNSFTPSGEINIISQVTEPRITVYLPEANKATGAAVILCPGGAMRILSWNNDVIKMAKWLNERGIAAIGLKYRLMSTAQMPAPKDPSKPFGAAFRVDIQDFQKFNKANANPSTEPEGTEIVYKAAADANEAILEVRKHAKEWNIDPQKVGFLGFSAGGGVAIAQTVLNTSVDSRPNFLAVNYGPSLVDVNVPENAPPLFICSNIDHPNVAAGCMALFMEWKKVQKSAEIHLFSGTKGGYSIEKQGKPVDEWSDLFLNWLVSEGIQKK